MNEDEDLDFKSISMLEQSKDKMFLQISNLTDSSNLYYLLEEKSRKKFFLKYYYTKQDIDILISVIFQKSNKAEQESEFEELFFLYFYLILIIKYSIQANIYNIDTILLINIDVLVKKTNELAVFFKKEDKFKKIITEFQKKEDFLSLEPFDSVIIEKKNNKLTFVIQKG